MLTLIWWEFNEKKIPLLNSRSQCKIDMSLNEKEIKSHLLFCLDPFPVNFPFLYTLKTPKDKLFRYFLVFKEILVWDELTKEKLPVSEVLWPLWSFPYPLYLHLIPSPMKTILITLTECQKIYLLHWEKK